MTQAGRADQVYPWNQGCQEVPGVQTVQGGPALNNIFFKDFLKKKKSRLNCQFCTVYRAPGNVLTTADKQMS